MIFYSIPITLSGLKINNAEQMVSYWQDGYTENHSWFVGWGVDPVHQPRYAEGTNQRQSLFSLVNLCSPVMWLKDRFCSPVRCAEWTNQRQPLLLLVNPCCPVMWLKNYFCLPAQIRWGKQISFKGTVSSDRFQKCWRKWTDLGLIKGRGLVLNFSEAPLIFNWNKTSVSR